MRVVTGFSLSVAHCLFGHALGWDQQPDGYEVIDRPKSFEDLETWRQEWGMWKKMELITNRYDPEDSCTVYNLPQTQWTQQNFLQVFVMMSDRLIYDRETQQYTVDKYVKEMTKRVGPFDSVVLWSGYPNSGIDNRNQWELMRNLPGGIEGLKGVIKDFHDNDIKIILPFNPWDTGTKSEKGKEGMVRMYTADIETIYSLVQELGADGINGDTMYGVPKSFYNCSNPLVASPEGGVPSAYLNNNPLSWGYYYGFSNFPPVARAKYLEVRHMVQLCARWSLDRTSELQMAFFNGAGYVVWENVWGIWNAMTEREDITTKIIFTILHKFGTIVSTGNWIPYYNWKGEEVYTSAFTLPTDESLYTIISTMESSTSYEIPLPSSQSGDDVRVYDVYHGVELQKETGSSTNGTVIKINLEPRGFGAVYVTKTGGDLSSFLTEMQTLTSKPLADYSMQRDLLQQVMNPNANSTMGDNADSSEMVLISGMFAYEFNVSGVQIEPVSAWTPTFAQFGTGVQFPWEDRPSNTHSANLMFPDFMIDKYPVTNSQYLTFLKASGYVPKSLQRFLDHWENRQGENPALWTIPAGLEQTPVVNVAVEDATAYANYYGKRLPKDQEWQYVASNGALNDPYPWGSEFDAAKLPKVYHGQELPQLAPVGSNKISRSKSFDVEDLTGYIWQMTDYFCDAHTCGVLLRGGSCYSPIPSTLADPNWFPLCQKRQCGDALMIRIPSHLQE
ncbi:SUMF1, FGE [Plasmopara halstedii]|uniref:SUMF1, FGE n=1 Tax=Plasmopara halstedii TaxID=4781 RepID=A0A0P1AVC1_PLAHL|nr:SUMF1, FGE [Plasmopara halstedii]CEG45701.1 SUMF1, FGE [Plasmopara halstedii]|eukprot:XP_024582070.1 SUMF1, FGE [Plasmopara halstedii]